MKSAWWTQLRRGFGAFLLLWSAAFAVVLLRLVRYAWLTEDQTHLLVIPCVSVMLFVLQQRTQATDSQGALPERGQRMAACLLWSAALGLLLAQSAWHARGFTLDASSALFLPVVSYVTGVLGGFLFFFGASALRAAAFPLLFLYFMVPLPEPTAHLLRVTLQHWSADAADVMFQLAGTPVFRDGQYFQFAGMVIRVAEECSGIHSSIALVITSLIAGHLFLKHAWSRMFLTLMVIPICVIRNAFRVVTLTLLSLHVNPEIIDGPLHHKGGPIFFALAVAVLLVLIELLRWLERRKHKAAGGR